MFDLANFKIGRGKQSTLPSQKVDGKAYFCKDTKGLYFDFMNDAGALVRESVEDQGAQRKITAAGLLKGNGNGGVSAAVAGTDYEQVGAANTALTTAKNYTDDHAENASIHVTAAEKALYGEDKLFIQAAGGYLPASGEWCSPAYGVGTFFTVLKNSNKSAWSTDGIHWIEAALPSTDAWSAVCYCPSTESFFAISANTTTSAFAEASKGQNNWEWVSKQAPDANNYCMLVYASNRETDCIYAVVQGSNLSAAKLYALNYEYWVPITAQPVITSPTWYDYQVTRIGNDERLVVYCNEGLGEFISARGTEVMLSEEAQLCGMVVRMDEMQCISLDSIDHKIHILDVNTDTEVSITVDSTTNWAHLRYANAKYILLNDTGTKYAYSSSVSKWKVVDIPSSVGSVSNFTYGSGMFIAMPVNGQQPLVLVDMSGDNDARLKEVEAACNSFTTATVEDYIRCGTSELTPGVSTLPTGHIYVCYE